MLEINNLFQIKYCRWYTTKQPENSDIENQAYIFTNREEFNDMSRRGEFLAIQEMLGNSYGFRQLIMFNFL